MFQLFRFKFGQKTRSHTVAHRRVAVYPAREWFEVLCVSVAVLCMGCTYAAYIFYQGTHATAESGALKKSTAIYDHAKIREVLTTYEKKAEHFESLRAHTPPQAPAPEAATSTPQTEEEKVEPEKEIDVTVSPVAQ